MIRASLQLTWFTCGGLKLVDPGFTTAHLVLPVVDSSWLIRPGLIDLYRVGVDDDATGNVTTAHLVLPVVDLSWLIRPGLIDLYRVGVDDDATGNVTPAHLVLPVVDLSWLMIQAL